METKGSVLEPTVETTATESERFHLTLSREEAELVRSGLETLLQIYTRHERYIGLIGGLLAKLHMPQPQSHN